MKWKEKVRNFIFWKENDAFMVHLNYLLSIAFWFPNFLPRGKEQKKEFGKERHRLLIEMMRNEKEEEIRREKFIELLESLVKQISKEGYSSILYPTIIQEPNLSLEGEKSPEEEEIWKTVYLLYCYSLKVGSSIITFDNIPEENKQKFWRLLIGEKIVTQKVTLAPISTTLGISLKPEDKFFVALSLLGYWIKKFSESEIDFSQDLWSDFYLKLGWSEASSLIIFDRGRGKATYCIFPRFSGIVSKWFDKNMSLLKFLNSLTYVKGIKKENLKLIQKEREKLIYHLFKYNEINGELLSSCINLKVSYELKSKEKQIVGFVRAKEFFSKLG